MPRKEQDFSAFTNAAPETGTMLFQDFVQNLRNAGVNPQNWLKAKHAGAISVTVDESGAAVVGRSTPESEGV